MRLLLGALIFSAAGALALGHESTQDDVQSIQLGVYTKAQAERGRTIFEQTCEACHHPDEFIEGGYMESWSGQVVSDFIDLVRSTMPQDSPGRLDRSEYVAIISYFFEINGVPAGDTEMDSDSAKKLRIEGPFEPF